MLYSEQRYNKIDNENKYEGNMKTFRAYHTINQKVGSMKTFLKHYIAKTKKAKNLTTCPRFFAL